MYYAWVTIGRLVMARFLLFSVYLLLASILSLFFVVSFSLWLSCSLFVFFSILWIPRNISPHFCHVSFFLVFYFSCSHDAFCFFFVFFSILYPNILLLLKVMLSCGIAIFHSSPTNNTSVKTALIIFNILTFFIFELLSVLAWAFFNKNHSTVLNTELI